MNATKKAAPRVASAIEDFTRDAKNRVICSQGNIVLALAKLGVVVRFDQFAERELIDGLKGFGPELDDPAMNHLWLAIDRAFQFRPAREFFFNVVSDVARAHAFHPVRRYLDGLTWDGVPRIDSWLVDYAGACDTAYVRAVGRLPLVAAVRRARHPGSKFDEMLVLESEQGTNKSTALKTMAVTDEWFTDDLPLGADTKRLMEAIEGRWIVEAGELKGMSRADKSELKAFLSRPLDRARMAYGRKVATRPRQCVFIGTTNETGGYLQDSTGSRRYWPVRVQAFDIVALRDVRDQLWAEASHVEALGESIRLDPSLYEAAAVEQEERGIDDPIEIVLSEALGELDGQIRITDCYRILDVDPGTARQDQISRMGAAMRSLGWQRKQRRYGGPREWSYVKGDSGDTLTVEGCGASASVTRLPRHGRL